VRQDWGSLTGESYLATRPPRTWHPDFVAKCKEVIRYYAVDRTGLIEWENGLDFDCVPALFGVLMCILPNLRALKLGSAWMMDFPIFGSVLAPGMENSSWLPWGWRHPFLDAVRDQLLSRLEILETPVDMGWWFVPWGVNTMFDFRNFANLKVLGISMRMLWRDAPKAPPNPQDLFPPSLEQLRICNAGTSTPTFVRSITTGKIAGHMPVLDRMEIHYRSPLTEMLRSLMIPRNQRWHPVDDIRYDCRAAGLAVYILFPADETFILDFDRCPWHLRVAHHSIMDNILASRNNAKWINFARSHSALRMDEIIFHASYEAEWDKDGNEVILA
jgi:hypothetical protein